MSAVMYYIFLGLFYGQPITIGPLIKFEIGSGWGGGVASTGTLLYKAQFLKNQCHPEFSAQIHIHTSFSWVI
jgi:hypothetical protein